MFDNCINWLNKYHISKICWIFASLMFAKLFSRRAREKEHDINHWMRDFLSEISETESSGEWPITGPYSCAVLFSHCPITEGYSCTVLISHWRTPNYYICAVLVFLCQSRIPNIALFSSPIGYSLSLLISHCPITDHYSCTLLFSHCPITNHSSCSLLIYHWHWPITDHYNCAVLFSLWPMTDHNI